MLRRIGSLFSSKQGPNLDDELRFHLEKEVEMNRSRGMSEEEARRQALIAFGGVQQTRENVRQTSWSHWIEILLQDARYGWRVLRKSPGVTTVCVLTLALGIGMNTAIFSQIDSILFRTLPASHPEELVLLRWHSHHRPKLNGHSSYGDCPTQRQGENQNGCSFSLPFFNLVRSQTDVFSGVAGFGGAPQLDLSGNGAATIVNRGELVSGDYFATLGIGAAAGRTLQPADDTPGAPPAMMLSYGFWRSAFGASPSAVGRTVRLNGIPFTIVGVAEQKFSGLAPGQQNDVFLPLSMRPRLLGRWTPEDDTAGSWWIVIVARLKPGVAAKQAQAAMTLLYADETLHAEKPIFKEGDGAGIDAVPAQRGLEGSRKSSLEPLYVLMMAVALVLLIACANIAGLLLARAVARSKEIAVRLTLGARRSRLLSQLLVESGLLALMGGASGLLLARWVARALVILAGTPDGNQTPFTTQLDGRVLAFTGLVTIATGLIFGIAPALRSLRTDLTPTLKSGTSAGTSSRSRWYGMGNTLVVAQVSLAIVALVSAGLLVRTLRNLKSVDLGFDAHNLLVFGLNPTLAGYKGERVDALFRDLQQQIAALPAVSSVSYSSSSLVSGSEWDIDFHAPGTPEKEASDTFYMTVGPKFFESMRIPLKAGRDFSGADYAAAAALSNRPPGAKPQANDLPVNVIVNEAFVRRFLPHMSPLGRHVEATIPEDSSQVRRPGWRIIGVCADARYDSLRGDIPPTMYAASAGSAYFSVRTAAEPTAMIPAIRDLLTRRDSNLAMYRTTTEEKQIADQVVRENLVARLSTFFSVLAMILACTGIYGLLSYEVTRRTREIGIRMAIGARRGNAIALVVRQGLLVALAGVVLGMIASLGAKGLLSTFLFGVKAGDPLTLAIVAVILLAVAMAASWLPARRATKVDPLVALRYE